MANVDHEQHLAFPRLTPSEFEILAGMRSRRPSPARCLRRSGSTASRRSANRRRWKRADDSCHANRHRVSPAEHHPPGSVAGIRTCWCVEVARARMPRACRRAWFISL
jgi:hypothetical protein